MFRNAARLAVIGTVAATGAMLAPAAYAEDSAPSGEDVKCLDVYVEPVGPFKEKATVTSNCGSTLDLKIDTAGVPGNPTSGCVFLEDNTTESFAFYEPNYFDNLIDCGANDRVLKYETDPE